MKDAKSNPWATRFRGLLDPAAIRQRAAVEIRPLQGLGKMPFERAARELERGLETVFYPTTQCVAILQRFAGMAHAHCAMMYSDAKQFLCGVYSADSPFPQFVPPVCLTGLGGTGKSALVLAFNRIQEPETAIEIDEHHSNFALKGPWLPIIQARSDPGDVLGSLCGMRGKPSELVKVCRKLAFRDGVPFVVPDEFQFATGSNSANARVTQMLFSLGYLGIPFGFVANFSLLLRLLKRPEEDRQRLLSDVIVLLPDPWDSEDWQNTLEAQRCVAPDVFKFDPKGDARDMHLFSAGRKRAVKRLLVIAFREQSSACGVVDMAAIRKAYFSAAYAPFREEAEILNTQAITNRPDKKRKDLWCPIPLQEGQAMQFRSAAANSREELVAETALRGALTETERQGLVAIEKRNGKCKKEAGIVIPLKKRNRPTADDLKQNANWLKDHL